MSIAVEVYEGQSWVDKTNKCTNFRWSISNRELETIEFEFVGDNVSVGQKIRAKKGESILFEGIVYERSRSHRSGEPPTVKATAYSNLILYDRHVVYRLYPTGTKAGEIIRDLASLEPGVNVSNVDDGPSLLSPWSIENSPALDVMRSAARGVNYWLRMKPGNMLYFKPRTTGSPSTTIDSGKIISAEYSEDRWKLKNWVIYVGADGEILANVHEGSGDLPVVVHDPFLTDPEEATRRANIRLALNKEYGRQLKVEMHQYDFESMNLDLGDTVRVNLPPLELTNVDMFLVEVEYDPGAMKHVLTLGGRLEMFEEIFEESIGGDVASRFGRAITIPEQTSTLVYTLDKISRIQADQKHLIYMNKPPINLYNAENIVLDSNGYAVLTSGATEGSFEIQVLPPSELFVNWIKSEWICEKNGGRVSARFLNVDGDFLGQVYDAYDTQYYKFSKWPKGYGTLTYRNASGWGAANASVTNKRMGFVNAWCLRLTPNMLGQDGEIYYPSQKNMALDLTWAKWLRIYLYADHEQDVNVKLRLHTDSSNYFQGQLVVKAKEWKRYEVSMKTLTQVGSPNILQINWISVLSPYPVLIDSDHMFLPATRELMRARFTFRRDSPNVMSPMLKLVKIIWREGA